MRTTRSLATIFFALLLVACQAGAQETDPGTLVIIGGSLDAENEEIYRAILDGREGDGALCVIPTAGGSPEASMERAVERIDRWGGEGTARGILITVDSSDRAREPAVAEEIRGCSGFFFTGGVQSRILEVFLPEGERTPAYEALLERFEEGAVVAGSSAGAAMMSNPMIAGGSSAGAFTDGVVGPEAEGGVRLRQGMGFLEAIPLDQHFLARGRIGRLLTVVLQEEDVAFGAGVDENTALVVERGRGRVVGGSGVIWIDGRRAEALAGEAAPAAGSGLRIELLGAGDELDLATGQVFPAEGKEALRSTAQPASGRAAGENIADDLFGRWSFLHLLHAMAEDDGAERIMSAEGYTVRLRAGDGFRGVAWEAQEGVQGTPYGLSVGPVEVEIRSD